MLKTDIKPELHQPGLIDSFAREIKYLRISLTDKCNMRCFYCLPREYRNFKLPDNWLTLNELQKVVEAFAALGVSHFRLTGGEPLVRPDIVDIVDSLSSTPGVEDLSLSTNASLLSPYATALKKAGLNRINVSLDSLNPTVFKQITGAKLKPVLDGLMAAKESGLSPVKINMLALQGINEKEILHMIRFCRNNGFTLRLIETMPMGDSGLSANKHYLPLSKVRRLIESEFDTVPSFMPGSGPAKYIQFGKSDFKVGFITPISQHFCETCNRVRLDVGGTIYLCLGQDHSFALKPLLKKGISSTDLKAEIIKAIQLKPYKHDFVEQPLKQLRIMSSTGG